MKITMLGGAGMMGKGIIRDLLSERALIRIDELLVPDSSAQRLEELQREFGTDPRLRLSQLDVTDAAALQACLVGADLCINSVPTLAGHQMLIFEAALNSRVHYIDLGGLGVYTVRQLEWRERFRETGVCAVLGVGGDPGMSNVICPAQ